MQGPGPGHRRAAVLRARAGEAPAAGAEVQGGEEGDGGVLHQQVRSVPISQLPRGCTSCVWNHLRISSVWSDRCRNVMNQPVSGVS
jgi:hypothetical protein